MPISSIATPSKMNIPKLGFLVSKNLPSGNPGWHHNTKVGPALVLNGFSYQGASFFVANLTLIKFPMLWSCESDKSKNFVHNFRTNIFPKPFRIKWRFTKPPYSFIRTKVQRPYRSFSWQTTIGQTP
jgi:hypothetical protein